MSRVFPAWAWVLGVLPLAVGCGDDSVVGAGGSGAAGGGGGGGAGGGVEGVSIPGLSAPITASYDSSGFLHLSCAEDNDCFAALGYFHAQNRFFFMDFVRNLVRGRLAKLVRAGDVVLAQDFENRRWFSTREGEPLERKLYDDASPLVRGHMDAYARGVNAWIADMRAARNDATLTVEYDFALIVKENIREWEPEDSAAVGLYVLDSLSNNSGGELSLGAQIGELDPALAPDLFSPRPVFDAFTVPAAELPPPSGLFPGGPPASAPFPSTSHLAPHRSLLREALDRLTKVGSGAYGKQLDTGSNNWAVGPTRSANGNAILANDPHLALTNPSIWFAVELDAKSNGNGDYHVAGGTFPGLPAIMVGHNESIGWGVTTAYYDLADVYVETLTGGGASVSFEGNDVAILEKELTFEDAESGDTVTQTFRWVPHHGPILSEDATSAVTIRWRGHDGGTDLDAFFALAKAGSVTEARGAVEFSSSVSQNFLIVDTAGDIGWFPYSKVPARPWASATLAPWLPLPGDGSAEWGAAVPFEDLPQLFNPPNGAIATANQDMTGASADGDLLNDGQAALQAYDKAEGTRQRRILDLLDAGGNEHSVTTLTDIQGDTFSLYGEALTPVILSIAATATLTPEEQALVDALGAWSFRCPTGVDGSDPVASPDVADATESADAIGCTAFHATLYAISTAALADDFAAAQVERTNERWALHLVARALKDPSVIASGDLLWDDVSTSPAIETRDQTVLRGLSLAAAGLAGLGTPNEWRWGRHHTLTLRSIFDNFNVPTYNEGPYAAPGCLYAVNVANPRDVWLTSTNAIGDLGFRSGASVRFVVEARPEGPQMTYQLPGGNDLHRESEFYNNLLPAYLENQSVPFPFGPGAVPDPVKVVEVVPAP